MARRREGCIITAVKVDSYSRKLDTSVEISDIRHLSFPDTFLASRAPGFICHANNSRASFCPPQEFSGGRLFSLLNLFLPPVSVSNVPCANRGDLRTGIPYTLEQKFKLEKNCFLPLRSRNPGQRQEAALMQIPRLQRQKRITIREPGASYGRGIGAGRTP